jgi:hypothetical protein
MPTFLMNIILFSDRLTASQYLRDILLQSNMFYLCIYPSLVMMGGGKQWRADRPPYNVSQMPFLRAISISNAEENTVGHNACANSF